MLIAILTQSPDFSAYLGEILRTWGLSSYRHINISQIEQIDPHETPVLVCPVLKGEPGTLVSLLLDYASRGGTLLCFLPSGALATAVGLEALGAKAAPLRLRAIGEPVGGLAGELLPVLGPARSYEKSAADATILAYLAPPYHHVGESIGVISRPLGKGKLIAFAFDLPQCVLLLRQGDPSRAEWFPPDIDSNARYSKTTHMAADLGPGCDGWIPFADILSRWFVELVRQSIPAPIPLLSHLPDHAPSVVLYSGDEDMAEVAWNDEEFDYLTGAGARMSLYIIPNDTHSTPSDVQRYQEHHDIGPHPNLRLLDQKPIPERLAEYERQVQLLKDQFGVNSLTTRHHCLTWVGYTDIVEVQERIGIRMDTNYIGGPGYFRHRETGPYFGFGAAMPMRFCRLDGRLFQVFQQHTHVEDDMWFGEILNIPYSLKLSPAQYRVIFERMLEDSSRRFHTPLGANFHPSNWVRFSGEQGRDTLKLAAQYQVPVWSFDQWCRFWLARDSWNLSSIRWNGLELTVRAEGEIPHPSLRLWIPMRYHGKALKGLRCNGRSVPIQTLVRFRESFASIAPSSSDRCLDIQAEFQSEP